MKYIKLYAASEWLEVRPCRVEDYDAWLSGYNGRKLSQSRTDEGYFDMTPYTREWYEEKLQKRSQWAEADFTYLMNIFRKADNASIGECDITTHFREDYQYARIGYTIHNQYWNQGYAKEAVKLLVQIGFEQLYFHRLEAHINLDNLASMAVARSAGLEFECVRKKLIYEDGQWTDNAVYVIYNESLAAPSEEYNQFA